MDEQVLALSQDGGARSAAGILCPDRHPGTVPTRPCGVLFDSCTDRCILVSPLDGTDHG
jgi:hypothetical protein